MFLAIDGTFWLQVLNFFVFYALLEAVFLKPVRAALRVRRAHIDGVQNDYESFSREVRSLRGEAEERRARARREAAELHAQLRGEAQRQAEVIAAQASTQATTIIEAAHATVASEMADARKNQAALVTEIAGTMVNRAVGSAA